MNITNNTMLNRLENGDCIGLDSYESLLEVSENEIDCELERYIECGNLVALYALGKVQTMRYKQRLDEIETNNIEKDIPNSSEITKMTRENNGIIEKRSWRPFMSRKSKRIAFNFDTIISLFALILKYDYLPLKFFSDAKMTIDSANDIDFSSVKIIDDILSDLVDRIGLNTIERLKELKSHCKNCDNKILDLNQKICEFCGLDL